MTEKKQTAVDTYPGYPTDRLHLDKCQSGDTIEIPDGPWQTSQDTLPAYEDAQRFNEMGLSTDSLGRPLHPQFLDMLTSPEGVVTGKGFYYHWGPNYTVDPIVMTDKADPQILLVKRGDTGDWALPGGFINIGEPAVQAGLRELGEETGVFGLGSPIAMVYDGPVADPRTTIHAWAETKAFKWLVDSPVAYQAGDDAVEAGWFYVDKLPDRLHGSHRDLIQLAIDYQPPITIADVLTKTPAELLNADETTGGHMAYHHLIVDSPAGSFFVKAYDPGLFTDPSRRDHSLEYLKKEYAYYRALDQDEFRHSPRKYDLVSNNKLAIEAYKPEDGWLWRAPSAEHRQRYIEEVLGALDELGTTTPELSIDNVESTEEVFQVQGWQSIDDTNINEICRRAKSLSRTFDSRLQKTTQEMLSSIPELLNEFTDTKPAKESLCHHDARQSNIAWHPELGVRIVDWSWAGPGEVGSDQTMFLIDLAKSNIDVDPYMNRFNRHHALNLIGFWLGHCLQPTRDGNLEVRRQQIASAATAFNLLRT